MTIVVACPSFLLSSSALGRTAGGAERGIDTALAAHVAFIDVDGRYPLPSTQAASAPRTSPPRRQHAVRRTRQPAQAAILGLLRLLTRIGLEALVGLLVVRAAGQQVVGSAGLTWAFLLVSRLPLLL